MRGNRTAETTSKQERHSERRVHKERRREKRETDGHRERQRERSRLMDMVQWSLVSSPSGDGRKAVCGFVVRMSQTLLRRYKHLDCEGSAEQGEAKRLALDKVFDCFYLPFA